MHNYYPIEYGKYSMFTQYFHKYIPATIKYIVFDLFHALISYASYALYLIDAYPKV